LSLSIDEVKGKRLADVFMQSLPLNCLAIIQ